MGRQPSPEFLRQWALVAYHEAGHVVVNLAYELPLYQAAIWTVAGRRGLVSVRGKVSHSDQPTINLNDNELPGYIIGALAGPEAEAIFLQQHDRCTDKTAREIAYGESVDGDLDTIRDLEDRVDDVAEAARDLVSARWAAVDVIARALQERGQLSARDIYRLAGTPRSARRAS